MTYIQLEFESIIRQLNNKTTHRKDRAQSKRRVRKATTKTNLTNILQQSKQRSHS